MMHRKAIWGLSLLALAALISEVSALAPPRPTASRPSGSSSSRVPTASSRPATSNFSRPTTPSFTRPTTPSSNQPRINSQPLPATSSRQSNVNPSRQTQPLQRQQGQSAFIPSSIPTGQKPQGRTSQPQGNVTGQKQGQSAIKSQGGATGKKQGQSAGIQPKGNGTSRPSGGFDLTDTRRSASRPFSPAANEQLAKVAEKLPTKGQEAIQAAREGRLMTDPQVDTLRKEAKNNKDLTPKERALIETALQKDMQEKRELLAVKRPNINVVLGGGGLGSGGGLGGGGLGGGGDSGDATIVQPTVVVPSVVQPTVVEPMIVTGGGGSTGTGGSSEPEVTVHHNRLLKVKNSTDEKLTVYVLIAVSDGSSETWSPGSPEKATEALVYELEAGQETYLSGDDGTLAGSRIRIWADSENGLKWVKFKTQDCVLAANAYEASELQTYTHNFTK